MPLAHGSSRDVIEHNIHEMVRAGHPARQAVAAALHMANYHAKKRAAGGGVLYRATGGFTPAAANAALASLNSVGQGIGGAFGPSATTAPANGGGFNQAQAYSALAGLNNVGQGIGGPNWNIPTSMLPANLRLPPRQGITFPSTTSGGTPTGTPTETPTGPTPPNPFASNVKGFPSYLAGTAGSPVNASALPTFTPQMPSSSGINSAGFMNVPQTGSYQLDPMTGALTPGTQSALQTLAQRGLPIGGQSAGTGSAAAPQPTAATPIAGGGGGTEGAGNNSSLEGAGAGGANTGNGGSSSTISGFNDPGAPGPSISNAGLMDLAGLGLSAVTANPLGAALAVGKTGYDVVTGNFGSMGGSGGSGDLSDLGGPSSGPVDTHDTGEFGSDAGSGGGSAVGGRIKRRQRGGGMISSSMATPWFTRSEARSAEHPSGLVQSPIGGRSDHIPLSLPSGSYVVPADIISGLGQSNTMAGAHAFDSMIHSGPFGTNLPIPKLGGTMPRPPSMPKMLGAQHFSKGGRTKGRIPVIVAGGERIVSPEEVMRLSGGDLKRGHEMLDRFIVEFRKHNIKILKALPGPAR